jgi:RNA polymerase II elongation factor ELL
MARQARIAFGNLKIPESDPLWEHVRYRNTVHAPTVTATTSSSQPDSQAPAVRKVKEKAKAPSRKKLDQPVMAKDESSRAHGGSGISAKDASHKPPAPPKLESPSASLPQKPVRRLPGSGFQAKSFSATPPVNSPSTAASQKKSDPDNVRENKREGVTSSGSTRPAQSMPTPPAKASPIPKKAKESANHDIAQDPGSSAAAKRRKLVKPEEGELIESDPSPSGNAKRPREVEDDAGVSVRKQRPVKQEEGELIEVPVKKKQKLEDGSVKPSKEYLAPPKKAATGGTSPISRPVAKDPVQNSSKTSRPADKSTSVPKSSSKHNGATKFRRGSEIYTSSEDERSPAQTAKSRQVSQAKPHAPTTIPVAVKKREHQQRPRAPLPKDVDGLRSRYKSTYLPYIRTYQQVVVEKTKLENALNGNFTDSDGDVDLMDAESLTKLTEEHKLYREELESIQAAYSKAGGKGLLGPEVGTSSPSD